MRPLSSFVFCLLSIADFDFMPLNKIQNNQNSAFKVRGQIY